MNEVVKRRAAGALVLIGLAFIAASLLPGVGQTPEEEGVKVVVIDLDAGSKPAPAAEAVALETPPATVAAPEPEAPAAETGDAQGTDSLPDPGETPAAEAEPEAEPPARRSLKLAEAISPAKPETPAAAEPAAEKPAKPAPPPATAATRPVTPATAPAPAPVPKSTAPAAAAAKPGSWFVQVGGFADIQNARQAQERLKAVGQASLIAPTDSAQGTLYRVRAGPYASREAALSAQQKIAAGGFSGSALIAP